MKQVPIGVQGDAQETVSFPHTLTSHHSESPPACSTPDMIRLMETAFHALQPFVKLMRSWWAQRSISSIERAAGSVRKSGLKRP
jgi:hypothetical protein